MNTLRIISDKSRYVVAALLMAFSVLVPTLASADQVTERSIALSSSTKAASSVTYDVKFTAVQSAGAFVVDFCTNSPLAGQSCTQPSGMVATSATTSASGVTMGTNTASKIIAVKSITAGEQVDVAFTGITNPTDAGNLYARIFTFPNSTDAGSYTSTAIGPNVVDQGSVALYITDGVAVSADVLESLQFCVSGGELTANCGGATAPVLKLGEDTGNDIKALASNAVSTGVVYTQMTTNAVNGAVVRLKSSNSCGGLMRVGATVCDIAPALTSGVAEGEAKFGVKLGTATAASGASNAIGTIRPFLSSAYNTSTYALNYAANNATGVTSAYGDELLDTQDAPVNNQNMPLTFGASINDNTPAGTYSTNLSLIATGKF